MARAKTKRGQDKDMSGVSTAALDRLAGGSPLLAVDDLHAGYGRMDVLRGVSLRIARGRSLCLVGPNGAGKSTVLNAIYGFARIFSGAVLLSGRDIATLPPSDKLKTARLAYVLQRGSVFPDMTVEENLLMGGYLLDRRRRRRRRPSGCSPAIPRCKRGGASAPMCCRAASGGCWKSPAR